MKENIETKDVQRTEYLDKNGLDMLWAKVKENTRNQVEVERNRAVAKENSITNSLSEFVSKTTTDVQYINSTLGILGGNMISVIDYTADGDPVSLELASTGLEFNGSDISTIELNGSDVNSNNGSRIIIEAHNENPQIALQSNVGSDYAFSDNLTITNKGISTADNNANHVYATDGSIADLTQYAKASALNNYVLTTALDKQVDTLNAAISGKQDAGNYIPYKNIAFKNKYVIEPSYSIEFRTDALNNKYGKAFIGPQTISITSASGQHAAVEPEEISVRQSGNASGTIHSTLNADSFGVYNNNDDSVIFKLNQYGIKLEDGDNNHVLTSNASTIDITQYVLKSVYDEKIAALEARIAALEAKHTETA